MNSKDPVQDYYDRKEAQRKAELQKLQELIASGATKQAIELQRKRVDQASYTGD